MWRRNLRASSVRIRNSNSDVGCGKKGRIVVMQYARKLRKGDKVAIVSLSSGMLGEEFKIMVCWLENRKMKLIIRNIKTFS